jgi:hypothetical protein
MVTTPDPAHNDYAVTLSITCQSQTQTFTGLGAFFPAGLSVPTFRIALNDGVSVGLYLILAGV